MGVLKPDISGVDDADLGRSEDSARHFIVGLVFKVSSNHFQGKIDLSVTAFPPANVINK